MFKIENILKYLRTQAGLNLQELITENSDEIDNNILKEQKKEILLK